MQDNEIIALYWARAEGAIAETAKRYGSYCYAIAWNILHRQEDAEECENDTWLAAWNTMPPARPQKLATFLGRLTRNIALDRYDYNTAQKRGGEFPLVLSELSECIAAVDNVEKQVEAQETADCISTFLRTQSKISRMVFVRRYWYADSIADIAKRFGMRESRVKSMLFRTRNKLRDYLEAEGVIL